MTLLGLTLVVGLCQQAKLPQKCHVRLVKCVRDHSPIADIEEEKLTACVLKGVTDPEKND